MSEITKPIFIHIEDHESSRKSLKALLGSFDIDLKQFKGIADLREHLENEQNRQNLTQYSGAIIDGELEDGLGSDAAELLKTKRPDITIISLASFEQNFGKYNILKIDAVKKLPPLLGELANRTKPSESH